MIEIKNAGMAGTKHSTMTVSAAGAKLVGIEIEKCGCTSDIQIDRDSALHLAENLQTYFKAEKSPKPLFEGKL